MAAWGINEKGLTTESQVGSPASDSRPLVPDVYCGLRLAPYLRQQVADGCAVFIEDLAAHTRRKREIVRHRLVPGSPGSNCALFERDFRGLSCRRGGKLAVIDRLAEYAVEGADGSICYNSRTGHGQMFWVGITCSIGTDGRFFMLSMLSINHGIQLDSVEMVEAGEKVDSKERQQNVGTCGKSMKTKWGRSSVG